MKKSRFAFIFVLALVFLSLVQVSSAQQQANTRRFISLPDANQLYNYASKDQPVRSALEVFGRKLRIAIKIDESISGQTTSGTHILTREAYLDQLGLDHDFVWYFDGIVLHVVNRDKLVSDTITLKQHTGAQAVEVLKRVGVFQSQFVHATDPVTRALYINGPAPYVDAVKSIVSGFDDTELVKLKLLRGTRTPRPLSTPELPGELRPQQPTLRLPGIGVAPTAGEAPGGPILGGS